MVKEVIMIIYQETITINFRITIFQEIKSIILITITIIICKIEIIIMETIIIIFYNEDTKIIINFLEIRTIIMIIIDNGIQDSIKTSTSDSFKIEINHMKIDFCKIITPKKIQIILK